MKFSKNHKQFLLFQEVSLHVVAISQQRMTTDHVEETTEPQTY